MKKFYDYAKSMPWLRQSYHKYLRSGHSRINVLETFPALVPNSGGSYRMLAPLTIQTINQLAPSMLALAREVETIPAVVPIEEFAESIGPGDQKELRELFVRHGSDKASSHDYYVAYAAILKDREKVTRLLEIGLGTNNTDIASHMGPYGSPGASLRAFRDFLPNAQIFGADVDARILFSEHRIETFQVDQTDQSSFQALGPKIGKDFDLMIDDGLHAINANLFSLTFFLSRLKSGGYAVIEDIPSYALEFWQVALLILSRSFEAKLIQASSSYMLVCRRQ